MLPHPETQSFIWQSFVATKCFTNTVFNPSTQHSIIDINYPINTSPTSNYGLAIWSWNHHPLEWSTEWRYVMTRQSGRWRLVFGRILINFSRVVGEYVYSLCIWWVFFRDGRDTGSPFILSKNFVIDALNCSFNSNICWLTFHRFTAGRIIDGSFGKRLTIWLLVECLNRIPDTGSYLCPSKQQASLQARDLARSRESVGAGHRFWKVSVLAIMPSKIYPNTQDTT